jgi:hypothetical protein
MNRVEHSVNYVILNLIDKLIYSISKYCNSFFTLDFLRDHVSKDLGVSWHKIDGVGEEVI